MVCAVTSLDRAHADRILRLLYSKVIEVENPVQLWWLGPSSNPYSNAKTLFSPRTRLEQPRYPRCRTCNGSHLRRHASKVPTSKRSLVRWNLHYLRMFLLPLSIRYFEFSVTANAMAYPTSKSTSPQESLDSGPGHRRQRSQAYPSSCSAAI